MTRRLLALVSLLVVVAAGMVLRAPALRASASPWLVCVFTVAFAVAGLLSVHLELRRNAFTVTPEEAVLVVALFHLAPAQLVLAVAVGQSVTCLVKRLAGKAAFNVAQSCAAAAVAGVLFGALGHPQARSPWGWAAAAIAVAAYFVVNVGAICTAVALAEHRPLREVAAAIALPAAVACSASACMGLLVAVLATLGTAVVLVAPVVGLLLVASRSVARHRSEHLRFRRLYAASSRTAGLTRLEDALVALAEEARRLVTGTTALTCVDRADGSWAGVVVDDLGHRPATLEELRAARDLVPRRVDGNVDHAGAATVARAGLPEALRRVAPGASDAVVAVSAARDADNVAVAVFRELGAGNQGEGQADVLAAFAGHAALTLANARLYQEVAEALARQVDLNRQKDDFLATVSHELRTPLTSILGAVDTIARFGDRLPGERRDQFCDMAKSQGQRLQRLIEDLLLVAATDAGTARRLVTEVDSRQLAAELEDGLGPLSAGRLSVELDPGLLWTDAEKLRRILVNLVENAVKYAPQGPIEVTAKRVGRFWQFAVADRGPGISMHDREKIFERFVQLDQSSTRRQGGTGLGLYLCRQLVEVLGGTISVSGRNGGGTKFTVRVPADDSELGDGSAAADVENRRLATAELG
jgi:signal transduction histidine kinase